MSVFVATPDLPDGSLRAVRAGDRPLVVCRAGGAWYALEDRCPHRHAPLSAGCATGEGLACPYHGWRFDRYGRLCEIPGLPPDAGLPAARSARRRREI